MLTRKQHELLMFIHERLKESGIPPSFDEMKDALDLKSKSGIHRLIKALEERVVWLARLRHIEKQPPTIGCRTCGLPGRALRFIPGHPQPICEACLRKRASPEPKCHDCGAPNPTFARARDPIAVCESCYEESRSRESP